MNVLFMTIAYPKKEEKNIYSDLMQEFNRNNHKVYVACASDKLLNKNAILMEENGINVLRILCDNLTGNVNLLKKGLATITLERKFINAINDNLFNIKFDLIIYSTPPITFAKAVEVIKLRDGAKAYLLLKDIFPQNAVDIGMMKKGSLVYRYFKNKENYLYQLSDYIGCMSEANVMYITRNNKKVNPNKIEVCPNSINPVMIDKSNLRLIRHKYGIPNECIAFIYGGNLGKPQGIDFIIECLKKNMNKKDRFFVICGKGKDYNKLKAFFTENSPANMILINGLAKEEYDELCKSCDVGLIFLDHRFTIPNFPSRMLSYMEYAMPIVACTDTNTDIGSVIKDGEFGWWCESNNSDLFKNIVDEICSSKEIISSHGEKSREFLENNYTVKLSYNVIMRHLI